MDDRQFSEAEENIGKDSIAGMGPAGLEVYDWLQSIMFALLSCVLIFTFLGRIVSVRGISMLPNLYWSDRLVVSNLFYEPKQGDIVVLRKESLLSDPIVKRVIALGGQTVDIDFNEGIVYVDGVALEEDYTAARTYEPLDFKGPVTVPEGSIFVMGDNRNSSNDSRDARLGCVDVRHIIGKAYFIVFPGSPNNNEKPDFGRLGSVYK